MPGNYALQKIHSLINSSQLINVSFNVPDQPYPVTLPMIGQMGSFDKPSADLGHPLDLYIHGYVSSRLFRLGRQESDTTAGGGLAVCCSVAHVDGLVLALSSFHHSYNYRSAVLFGHATLVEDEAEKLYAMELITNSVVPGRWDNTRLPPTKAEIQSTSILRVKIRSGSAKIRDGGVSDEKFDLENQDLLDSTWTGVVPIHKTMGEPSPTPYNRVELPAYAKEFFDDFKKTNEEYSLEAAAKEKDK